MPSKPGSKRVASRPSPIRSRSRLRWMIAVLFLGLALPAGVLIRQGFVQLDLQEFRRQQLIAEGLVRAIDTELIAAVAVENARPFADFEFARIDAVRNRAQRSPLSSPMPASAFPGAIGYFQVDASGTLSTPLLPQSNEQDLDLARNELELRRAAESRVARVLEANRLVRAPADDARGQQGQQAQQVLLEQQERQTLAPVSAARSGAASAATIEVDLRGQAAFDALTQVTLADAGAGPEAKTEAGAEAEAEAEAAAEAPPATPQADSFRDLGIVSVADMVGGDLEPFRFSRLDTGHLVLFRNAWEQGQRFVQGVLVDPDAFVAATHRDAFVNAGLAPGTRLQVTAAGEEIASLDNEEAAPGNAGERSALHAARLSPPLADIALSFQAGRLPRGPGFDLLVWTAVALFGVLLGGFTLMYRFGAEQLRLAQQQQSFVSAVSHELKTPLTSIRMYGEMLKSGWASEEKKQTYYDFILAEGERLSRLIDNVLQLARLNRGGPAIALEPVTIDELLDVLRSRLIGHAERAGFALKFEREPAVGELVVNIDSDALTQVFINLVDNAIKFASDAERKTIVVAARQLDPASVILAVRDFGPGIRQADMKRLFELFYRPDNELTRTTAGTGIGLALVQQLVTAMDGRVDVRNLNPGAEFRVLLPVEPAQPRAQRPL